MRVLVIGSGAREHALCWAINQSNGLTRLYCAPGNAGTAEIAENVRLDPMNFKACAAWALEHAIDFTVIGPDDPLAGGIVDVFAAHGLKAFGPTAAAARIESSKAWAKRVMLAHGIPTAHADTYTDPIAAHEAISRRTVSGDSPVVIKADGLAAGKGVVIANDAESAHQALDDLLVNHKLGRAGNEVLLEDYLEGWELSLFALTDGEHAYLLAPARDYKRALDGNQGKNTGGMGAYSPPAAATPELLAKVKSRIVLPTLQAIEEEAGCPFRGLLYAGLMITASGPVVVEFNARFGDPETQVVVPRLRGDFLQMCLAAAEGNLEQVEEPGWSLEAMCAVVLASAGYPGPFDKGAPISGLDRLDEEVMVFHAGTERDADGQLRTSGGRVLTVAAPGATVAEARARVYNNLERIHFAGAHWRKDIAADEIGG